MQTLAKALGRILPPAHRGKAGGIASGLVRIRAERLSRADVEGVLARYGADDEALSALEEAGVLVGSAKDGYALALPDEAGEKRGSKAEKGASGDKGAPDASGSGPHALTRTGRPKPPARQQARSLAGLDCVRKQTPELNDLRRKIIDLDPRLWINGWLLSTPDAYVRYERELLALDRALCGRPQLGDGTLSCRELSYRVFGDEKFLALDADGRKLLHLMGLSDVIFCRPQAKLGLLHHIPRHHKSMRLVVSENLDPWINMRDAMYFSGKKRIFGERVHGVVFGTGYLVNDPRKLPDLVDALGASEVEVLYWGDIDRAGLQILDKLAHMADEREGGFEVTPFAAAYRLMLKRAMRRFPDPLENEPCDQAGVPLSGLDLLEPLLEDKEAAYLRAVVENSRLIPQEILTHEDL